MIAPVPLDLLTSNNPVLVSKYVHLQHFIMETGNTNGEPYPPATLQSLLSGINHILKANKAPFSIFNNIVLQFDAEYGFTE